MDHRDVRQWVQDYERVWRTPETGQLGGLFTEEATYQMSPWEEPVRGAEGIAELWEAEREGPDEEFTLTSEVLTVDGDVAVVRAEVEYAATGHRWRDLWVLRFAADGRCAAFEEWPFAPDQPDGHS
jgi:ketosteroid isomerase-like protein